MAQLPLIRQNQAANAHIDGATPSYLPIYIYKSLPLEFCWAYFGPCSTIWAAYGGPN